MGCFCLNIDHASNIRYGTYTIHAQYKQSSLIIDEPVERYTLSRPIQMETTTTPTYSRCRYRILHATRSSLDPVYCALCKYYCKTERIDDSKTTFYLCRASNGDFSLGTQHPVHSTQYTVHITQYNQGVHNTWYAVVHLPGDPCRSTTPSPL